MLKFKPAENSQNQPRTRFFYKDIEQMHLALGMLGLEQDHRDKYVLILLNIILGGNMSSRLFDVIREKKGLAYSISSGVKHMADTGMFLVRAGVDNTKIVEATQLIIQELERIKTKGVSRDEFTRAKDYFLGQLLLGLEDTLDHMLWIADSIMVRDRVLTLNNVLAQVQKIKPADISRVARAIIKPEHFNLAIVGPVKDKIEEQLKDVLGG